MRIVMIAVLLGALGVSSARSGGEYRAFWADGFNSGFITRAQIDTLMMRLHDSNCNAVWPQMRKRGDAHYRSTYEPWAREDQQHFDALQYMLDKAHSSNPRIEVHAWLNTCAVGGDTSPTNILMAHPEYTSISDEGVEWDNEAMKIDPGNPGAADWTFRVYMDVARHYDVDGIHFDFVRYGHPRWGFNRESVALFNALNHRSGKPKWDDPKFQQWRRDQVTNLVRKVYAFAHQIKPNIKVSAATIAWGNGPKTAADWLTSPPYSRVYQDWRGWMQEGILDLNCPMLYFSNTRYREYWLNWLEFAKNHKYNRQLVTGSGIWLNGIGDSIQQIDDIRSPSANGKASDGILLYSYAGTNTDKAKKEVQFNPAFYSALSKPSDAGKPPFAKPAAIPQPIKTRRSIIKGFVLTDPWLAPVVGAKARLFNSRSAREISTDVTGFYALIDVPPGTYNLKITTPSKQTHIRRVIVPSAPSVVTVNEFLSTSSKPTGRVSDGWVVTGGTDRFKDLLYVWSPVEKHGRRINVQPNVPLVFQPGDVVAVSDLPGGLQSAVRFTDIKPTVKAQFMQVTQLAACHATTGFLVKLKGRVSRLAPNGFYLKDGTGEALVSGEYLKDDYKFTVSSGTTVEVTGPVDRESAIPKVCALGADFLNELASTAASK